MSLWRSVCGLIVVAATLAGPPVRAQAQAPEKRIALVIGNGAYQDAPLATPANDAGLIAQTLQAAGFDVVGARDLDTATLRSSMREFVDKATASGPNTVAMVYYAGYGLQFEGQNYLVPTDARIARPADVPLAAVRLSDILGPLAAVPLKARLVVMDAARNNPFARTDQPLAGGLALMQPDPGTLIAFNAAPGTVAPEGKDYSAYATALSEMIKAGGLSLDDVFERVRLRVSELTQGAEIAWYASKVDAPFLFFARTAAAPPDQTRFAELRRKPIREFDAHDAYLAALTRDTMAGYEEFLAAYPSDPLAKRARAILAARREAIVWRESAIADTPDAYWSYLGRYPRGLHAWDARRRLTHFAVAYEPPASFAALTYDVPPPPPDEIVYVERPVIYLADSVFALPPPPPVPVFFLPPQPVYYVDLPPPPPPVAAFVLPIPIWHPVPEWVDRPAYVAPPPVNLINVNIHNTVIVNENTQSVTVTNPQGQAVPPLPANIAPPAAPVPANGAPATGGPLQGAASLIQAHPVAAAAIAATAAVLPAAALMRSRQLQAQPHAAPAAANPAPGATMQQHPGQPPVPGQLPAQPQIPAAGQQPVAGLANRQALPAPVQAAIPPGHSLPVPSALPVPAGTAQDLVPMQPGTAVRTTVQPQHGSQPSTLGQVPAGGHPSRISGPVQSGHPVAALPQLPAAGSGAASRNSAGPRPASPARPAAPPVQRPSAEDQQRAAAQAAQQRAAERAQVQQQRAAQAAQQRATQQAQSQQQQQRAAQAAAQQRTMQSQRSAQQAQMQQQQRAAQAAAQQRAMQSQQRAAQQAQMQRQRAGQQHAAMQARPRPAPGPRGPQGKPHCPPGHPECR